MLFVNSPIELYSQLKDIPKDTDANRIIIKTIVGGFMGFIISVTGKIGERILIGKDDKYKTIFETGAGLVGGLIQSDIDMQKAYDLMIGKYPYLYELKNWPPP